jgi:hypothetical protein
MRLPRHIGPEESLTPSVKSEEGEVVRKPVGGRTLSPGRDGKAASRSGTQSGLEGDGAAREAQNTGRAAEGAEPKQDTPGRAKSASSRQQTQSAQKSQASTEDLDAPAARR